MIGKKMVVGILTVKLNITKSTTLYLRNKLHSQIKNCSKTSKEAG